MEFQCDFTIFHAVKKFRQQLDAVAIIGRSKGIAKLLIRCPVLRTGIAAAGAPVDGLEFETSSLGALLRCRS